MDIQAVFPTPIAFDVDTLAKRFRLPVADLERATAHAVSLVFGQHPRFWPTQIRRTGCWEP